MRLGFVDSEVSVAAASGDACEGPGAGDGIAVDCTLQGQHVVSGSGEQRGDGHGKCAGHVAVGVAAEAKGASF